MYKNILGLSSIDEPQQFPVKAPDNMTAAGFTSTPGRCQNNFLVVHWRLQGAETLLRALFYQSFFFACSLTFLLNWIGYGIWLEDFTAQW